MGSALLEASPKQLVATGCFMGLISHAHAQTVTITTITTTFPYFRYFQGHWSACSPQCGSGTRSRTVECQHTCSVYICPKADQAECSAFIRPANSEDCNGPPCPEATTVTATLPITSTLVTFTVTTTEAVAAGVCSPIFGGDRSSCLPQAEAALRCRAGCPCCQLQQDDGGSSGTTALEPSDGGAGGGGSSTDGSGRETTTASSEDGSPTVIIIAVTCSCALIALVIALLWWRSCIRRAEKSRALREKYAEKIRDHAAQVEKEKTRTTSFRTKKQPTTNNEDGTIFDREFGAGVPSAPPEGYKYNESSDAEEGRAGGASGQYRREGPSPTNRGKFKANGDKHWKSSEQPDVAASNAGARTNSPNGRQRRADKSEESDECLTPPSGSPRSKQPETGSSTLPPGFAAASRAQRRTGKDFLDPSSFADAQEPPPQMPGQANSESDETPKGTANNGSSSNPRRGMATPPRANEAPPRDDSQNKKTKEPKRPAPGAEAGSSAGAAGSNADASAGASGNSSAGGGSNQEQDDDPRVAKETAASAAASDLIAKVDHELDEALNKDLETRRKIFKALILQWHPDKNQEEDRATEVFRYLMARRPRYLQEA